MNEYQILSSDIGLSFWGGIDPLTGIIIDQNHPLHNQCIHNKILCIPSGRGSCTGSQVMLELILNHKAPKALLLRDLDVILCTGAIIAQEFFVGDDYTCYDDLKHTTNVVVNDGSKGMGKNDATSRSALDLPLICHLGKHDFDLLRNSNVHSAFIQYHENDKSVIITPNEHKEHSSQEHHTTHPTIIKSFNLLDIDSSPSPSVSLTPQQYSILTNTTSTTTKAQSSAMKTIYRIAKLSSAPNLLPVHQAHIDGCTYIGPGGLSFVSKLLSWGGQVIIPTTLNSVSADRRRWHHLGVTSQHAHCANTLGDVYLQLGCTLSFTCAPYLLPSKPIYGENIVWGESNAVVYANSMIGARTEKIADYLDICAAITGVVPNVGVYWEEYRKPRIILDVMDLVKQWIIPLYNLLQNDNGESNKEWDKTDLDSFFPTLGWICGILSDGKVPLIRGMEQISFQITNDDMKAFCAAFGTTGTAPLFHMVGVTPEVKNVQLNHQMEKFTNLCNEGETVIITRDHLMHAFESLDSDGVFVIDDGNTVNSIHDDSRTTNNQPKNGKVDLIAFGNPHLSITELSRLASLASPTTSTSQDTTNEKHPDVKVIATLSRHVQELGEEKGYIQPLIDFGFEFVNDTCWCMMLDPPIIPPSVHGTIMTNSGKYAHYGPGLTKRKMRFGSMVDCMETAKSGVRVLRSGNGCNSSNNGLPSWLKLGIRSLMTFSSRSRFR